jgi:hypothetical protein
MPWLTIRQHRLELGTMLIGALVVALACVGAALYIASVRTQVGLDACPVVFGTPDCVARFNEYLRLTGQLRGFPLALYLYPVVVAAFLAGPMFARDFERGTHRLVWTQGITRLRWAVTKVAIVSGVAVVSAIIVASVSGLTHEFTLGSTGPWQAFDFEPPVVVSYLLFAIALGAASGVLLQRTVAGMLASLVLFVGTRILVEWKLRPNFVPTSTVPAGGPDVVPVPQDAWQLGVRYVYASSGGDFPQEEFNTLMRNFRGGDLHAYLASHDVVGLSFYHPVERYWLFQSIEAAIFLGLSLVLVLLTLWLVQRRA